MIWYIIISNMMYIFIINVCFMDCGMMMNTFQFLSEL